MDNFEKVEKLVERANVSFEEAKEALEASNWDMLDAMIFLEKKNGTARQAYTTTYESETSYGYGNNYDYNRSGRAGGEKKRSFGDWLKGVFKKSDENHFRICKKDGSKLVEIPIWLSIIILLAFWHLCLILFVVGLFCGCSFSFVGPDRMETANKVMDSCENAADSIKDAVSGNSRQ